MVTGVTAPQVENRPLTQHGLGGMKNPKTSHGVRQIQDRNYWMGLIGAKTSEVKNEILGLQTEMRDQEEQAESYITYKAQATQSANELQELQAKLQDANTVLEKHHQGHDSKDIEMEIEDLMDQAGQDQEVLTTLFNERQKREEKLKEIESEIERHMSQTQQMKQNMNEAERESFKKQQDAYSKVSESIQEIENQIEATRQEVVKLENELAHDPRRRELIPLYTEYAHLKSRKNEQEKEEMNHLTPEQEREKLIRQTKQDNQALVTMEKQLGQSDDRINRLTDELRNIETDLDESSLQRMKGLRKTEEKFKQFMEQCPKLKEEEVTRLGEKESQIQGYLMEIAAISKATEVIPSKAAGFKDIKSTLRFKEKELYNNEGTVVNLDNDHRVLQSQLAKVEKLETKLVKEKQKLLSEIQTLEVDINEYKDIDGLTDREREKANILEQLRGQLTDEILEIKLDNERLHEEVSKMRDFLKSNDEQVLLENLERRWVNGQQNNFSTQEFIATRVTDCAGLQSRCRQHLFEYNQLIIERLKTAPTQPY